MGRASFVWTNKQMPYILAGLVNELKTPSDISKKYNFSVESISQNVNRINDVFKGCITEKRGMFNSRILSLDVDKLLCEFEKSIKWDISITHHKRFLKAFQIALHWTYQGSTFQPNMELRDLFNIAIIMFSRELGNRSYSADMYIPFLKWAELSKQPNFSYMLRALSVKF